jgi:hypothetical protein
MAHPFAHFAKGWGIARSATVLFAAALIASAANGQTVPCGITLVQDTAELNYPPIARAAHQEGSVIILTTFDRDGSVAKAETVSGPMMLRDTTLAFVKGRKVDASEQIRECPITVTFHLVEETFTNDCQVKDPIQQQVTQVDPQHVDVVAQGVSTCDPDDARVRHRFLFFHWHSKSA